MAGRASAPAGALAVCAAADDARVRGVAALGAPADFDDWAATPAGCCCTPATSGSSGSGSFPPAFDAWSRELREIRAVAAAPGWRPGRCSCMHGTDDDSVPVFDARVLADAHGDADLRIIDGAGHRLRHDPRAVAILLGWLDRQRNRAADRSALPPCPWAFLTS